MGVTLRSRSRGQRGSGRVLPRCLGTSVRGNQRVDVRLELIHSALPDAEKERKTEIRDVGNMRGIEAVAAVLGFAGVVTAVIEKDEVKSMPGWSQELPRSVLSLICPESTRILTCH